MFNSLLLCAYDYMDDREEEREEHLISYLQDFRPQFETVAVSTLFTHLFFGGRLEYNVMIVDSR